MSERCDLDALEAKAKAAQFDSMTGGINLPGFPSVVLGADVVLEFVRRLREAEGIVRDLAGKEPREHPEAMYPRCVLCGAEVTAEDNDRLMERHGWSALDAAMAKEPPLPIAHAKSCPYRRAVDATRREEG